MRKTKMLSLLMILCLMVSAVLPMLTNNVQAAEEDVVTLHFQKYNSINYGAVSYSQVGSIELYKDRVKVDITENDMKIDLSEGEYEFFITENTDLSAPDEKGEKIRYVINDWAYNNTDPNGAYVKLDPLKFSGTLNIKMIRADNYTNTKIKTDVASVPATGTIDLRNDYVVDFSKDDDITKSLRAFAGLLDETLYYKNENGALVETTNPDEAIIKVVGNKAENKATFTAMNVGDKIEEKLCSEKVGYIGSFTEFDDEDGTGLMYETRTNYYVYTEYNFTFKYADEQIIPEVDGKDENTGASDSDSDVSDKKEEEVKTEIVNKAENSSNPKTGDNIILYVAIAGVSFAGLITMIVVQKRKNK